MLLLLFKTLYFSALVFVTFSVFLAPSQQRRLLSMVGVLLQLAFVLLLLHFEYTAFIVVVVYVGAIAVLFLFVIMLVSLSRPASAGSYALAEAVLFWALVGVGGLGAIVACYAGTDVWVETWATVMAGASEHGLSPFALPTHRLFLSPVLSIDDPVGGGVLFTVPGVPSARLPNPEIEQLGVFLWTEGGILVVLGGLVLLVAIVGSVAVLRGVLRSNLHKRARLIDSSTTSFALVVPRPRARPGVEHRALHDVAHRPFCSSPERPPLKNPLPGLGLDRILGPAAELLIFVSYRRTYRFYYRRCREATKNLSQTTRYVFEYLCGWDPVVPVSRAAWPRQYLTFLLVWFIFFVGVLYHAPLGVICLWARRTWRYWAFETDPDFWGGVTYLYNTMLRRQYRHLRLRHHRRRYRACCNPSPAAPHAT